jgi:transcriptional regulator with XRE-family HTH domain
MRKSGQTGTTDIEMSRATFGKLVKTYRQERGWSQEELAARWGYTRVYVSQIERGIRTLNHADQVARLADILEIPPEHLGAIGKGVPQRREAASAQSLKEADDFLLQTLLEPAMTTVKLSWLVWYANHDTTIVQHLTRLIAKLEDAITNRRGQYLQPAQQILAYAHEMLGKIAFDRLDFMTASGHFQEMGELGEELHDPDITALSLMHQGDILRRRGRFEHAVRCLEGAARYAQAGTPATQGLRWQHLARAYAEYGHKSAFLQAIDEAEQIARAHTPDLDATSNQFNLVDVIQERAQGYTLLWEPETALNVYKESERLKPFRPMRDLGVFVILRAQAHTYAGDVDQGINFALHGLRLARGYQSKRHETRIKRMYDKVIVTPLGKHPRLTELKDALRQSL